MGNQTDIPSPYRSAGPVAHWIKAVLQMIIGAAAALATTGWAIWRLFVGDDIDKISKGLFSYIGFALAAAAAVELAYTLYTHGADEALDPLMLGLSAALLVQLGQVEMFDWHDALAALLYVSALAALFATRKHLAEVREPADIATWRKEWKERKECKECKSARSARSSNDEETDASSLRAPTEK